MNGSEQPTDLKAGKPSGRRIRVLHVVALAASLAWLAVMLSSSGWVADGIAKRGPTFIPFFAAVDHYDRLPALVTYYLENAGRLAGLGVAPLFVLWIAVLRIAPLRRPRPERLLTLAIVLCLVMGVAIAAGATTYLSGRLEVWDARYAENRLRLASNSPSAAAQGPLAGRTAHYAARYGNFLNVPASPAADVIFVGDSITEPLPWSEYFPALTVLNRGIGNDKIEGVVHRIAEINRHRPKIVSLMIGLNDISPTAPMTDVDRMLRDYGRLVDAFDAGAILVHPILPIRVMDERDRPTLSKSLARIAAFNNGLRELCDGERVHCAGMPRGITDSNGELGADMTVDGAHLSGDGAKTWVSHIKSLSVVRRLVGPNG